MPTIKLAEALLRRKELQEKVNLLQKIKASDLFEVKAKRVNITESIDDIVATVPKLTASQVTAEYDWHARQLRMTDAAIQQANWTTDIDSSDFSMGAYQQPPGKHVVAPL
jgi:hypothetical protein